MALTLDRSYDNVCSSVFAFLVSEDYGFIENGYLHPLFLDFEHFPLNGFQCNVSKV